MIKKFALAAVCAIGLASPAFAASIQIDDAEAIFEADENTFEVFMTITNSGAAADTLYAVKSKVAKSSRLNVSSIEEAAACWRPSWVAYPLCRRWRSARTSLRNHQL